MEELGAIAAVDSATARKGRGAFFTPSALCDFVTNWAVRTAADRVLEPSCGEAAFLLSAGRRLRELGATGAMEGQLCGVELHEPSAHNAALLLRSAGFESNITVGSFFEAQLRARADAICGNPPYVRYQDFTGQARARSQAAALAQGVRLSGLASSWASFVVHAAQYLTPEGRMGLVLPGELLTVSYAAEVRSFLMRRFGRLRLVLFEERVFPGVMEEVLLLLAEGSGGTDQFELYQATDVAELAGLGDQMRIWRPGESAGKWLSALLDPSAFEIYTGLSDGERFESLRQWGSTTLGMVTGRNNYFAVTAADAEDWGIGEAELLALSPPGSKHLKGLTVTSATWRELVDTGARAYLFYPSDDPSRAAQSYIDHGVSLGIDRAYKCRVRNPWWRVPLVPAPDLFLTYMNHQTPRLVRNEAKLRYLNSVHGVRFDHGRRALGRDLLPIASLNTVTLLGAEVVGRSYGGGLLKLEPTEADVLPVPAAALLTRAAKDLKALRAQLGKRLRGGDVMGAVRLVDDVLLVRHAAMKRSQVGQLRTARDLLFARRAARGNSGGPG